MDVNIILLFKYDNVIVFRPTHCLLGYYAMMRHYFVLCDKA